MLDCLPASAALGRITAVLISTAPTSSKPSPHPEAEDAESYFHTHLTDCPKRKAQLGVMGKLLATTLLTGS